MTSSPPDAPLLAGMLAVLLTIVLGIRIGETLTPGPRRNAGGGGLGGANLSSGRSSMLRLATRWRRWRVGTDVGPDQVAVWCDGLARSLRGGNTLRHSLLRGIPANPALRDATHPLRQALERGRSVTDAIVDLLDQQRPTAGRTNPHLRLVGSVLAGSADIGGSAAAPLDRVAAALRLRVVDGQERAAHSAQARLSAHVLTLVPVGVLALLVSTDAHVRSVVVRPVGAALLAAGMVLNLSGWWWMRYIIGNRT